VLARASRRRLRVANAELQQRVSAHTVELETANKELEAFSYSVSHDLRAPLRAITGFSEILMGGSPAELSSEGRRHLQTVVASAKRMERLIEDLLAFSRLGRQPCQSKRCASAIAAGRARELQESAGWAAGGIQLGACRIARAMLLC